MRGSQAWPGRAPRSPPSSWPAAARHSRSGRHRLPSPRRATWRHPSSCKPALIKQRELGTACPAGYTTIPALGNNSSGPPNECYRLTGDPATFTSATVIVDWQPALWVLRINLLPPDAAALTAIIATTNESGDDIVAIVAGKAWTISGMHQLPNGQFEIVAGSSKEESLPVPARTAPFRLTPPCQIA